MDERLAQIRESERKSHMEIYSNDRLYRSDSWLQKPIKAIQDLIPLYREYKKLRVLDLGCGVGRNCIAIACEYKTIDCVIECVDILELAINKLHINAMEYGVSPHIHGVIDSIEHYSIKKEEYDLIIAVSALEHMDTAKSFAKKLAEIRDGVCHNGIICLVINSNIREYDKKTEKPLPAQFEINLPTEDIQSMLNETFSGWAIIKSGVTEQQYDIPRQTGLSRLQTSAVSFVARKEQLF